jgi:hypothetical protein
VIVGIQGEEGRVKYRILVKVAIGSFLDQIWVQIFLCTDWSLLLYWNGVEFRNMNNTTCPSPPHI